MVESGAVQNVLAFGDEVVVEITITNPAMQARKKVETEIIEKYNRTTNRTTSREYIINEIKNTTDKTNKPKTTSYESNGFEL